MGKSWEIMGNPNGNPNGKSRLEELFRQLQPSLLRQVHDDGLFFFFNEQTMTNIYLLIYDTYI
jgi:hypothetical protein